MRQFTLCIRISYYSNKDADKYISSLEKKPNEIVNEQKNFEWLKIVVSVLK